MLENIPSMGEIWIFSGTTHFFKMLKSYVQNPPSPGGSNSALWRRGIMDYFLDLHLFVKFNV